MQVAHHLDQREAVAGRQRQHDRVLGGRGLQFEVELAAETLAQRQSPGLVDAAAIRRMDDQLGAAGFVEESLQRDVLLGGQHAEAGQLRGRIFDDLRSGGGAQRESVAQPAQRGIAALGFQPRLQLRTQPRHRLRQFDAAARRFAQPERDAGRQALRILHPHLARLDAQDAITGIAELEHVAGHALDREILVDAADDDRLRLQQHAVVADVGNGAARLRGDEPRALAPPQLAVHGVAMQIGGALAETGAEAVGQHPHHLVEVLACQRCIRLRAPHQGEQRVLVPLARRHFRHDLLRQHVQRRGRHDQRVELAAPHAIQQGRAFQQLVAGGRQQPALGHATDLVAGTAHPLQERGDAARRTDLADQIDVADVDAEFQRGGGDQHLERTGLEPLFGIQPQFLRQRPVMRGDMLLAQQLAQMPRRTFRHAPGVDEHQRGRMLLHQFGDARVHQLPLRVRHHRFQRHRRQFEGKVAFARVTDVDDCALFCSSPCMCRGRPGGGWLLVRKSTPPQPSPARRGGRQIPGQELRDCLDRLLRRRQSDARRSPAGQRIEALQRQRKVAAALVLHQRMDFIDDHRAHTAQHRPPGIGTEQHVQRFRGGHQDMRGAFAQRGTFGLRGVAGAYRGADVDLGPSLRGQLRADAGQRCLEIDVDIVRQRLQRRDVEHLRRVRQAERQTLAKQHVDGGQERRQRLAGTGRRGDERVAAAADRRPGGKLGLGRCGETAREPRGDGGMEGGECRIRQGLSRGHARIIRRCPRR